MGSKKTFDFIEAIQLEAVKSVMFPDEDAHLRRIFRWYSEKFHTPLHEVDDLPIEEVLLNYFECEYEELEEAELEEKALFILETPDERKLREKDNDDFIKQAELLAKAQASSNTELIPERIKDIYKQLKSLDNTFKEKTSSLAESKPTLKPILPPTEEVSIRFTDDNLLDSEADYIPSKK